jgi:hypothetical protein
MSGEEHIFLPLARNVSSVVIVSGDVVLRHILTAALRRRAWNLLEKHMQLLLLIEECCSSLRPPFAASSARS